MPAFEEVEPDVKSAWLDQKQREISASRTAVVEVFGDGLQARPRVHQHRGTALKIKAATDEEPDTRDLRGLVRAHQARGRSMNYAELQVTTHFSFLRGVSSAEELFSAAEGGNPGDGRRSRAA